MAAYRWVGIIGQVQFSVLLTLHGEVDRKSRISFISLN